MTALGRHVGVIHIVARGQGHLSHVAARSAVHVLHTVSAGVQIDAEIEIMMLALTAHVLAQSGTTK